MTTVGTAGFVDVGGTAGSWRRSASLRMYAGRPEGKDGYVKGDLLRILRAKKEKNKVRSDSTSSKSWSNAFRRSDVGNSVASTAATGTCVQVAEAEVQTETKFEIVEHTDLGERTPGGRLRKMSDLGERTPGGRLRKMSVDNLVQTMEGLVNSFSPTAEVEEAEGVEVASGSEETMEVLNDEELRHKQTVKLLFYSTAAHNCALQLTLPANQSIWLNHFDGDFGAQAETASNLTTAALAAGVFVNPVIASTSDVVGRKPVVMGGLAISALGKVLCAVRPGAPALRVQTVLMTPLAMAHALGVQTSLADIFAGDGKGFGAAQAQMLLATTMPGLVCPLIGASLTQKLGPAAPFALAGIAEAGALLMDSKLLSETQRKEERKPFVLRNALKSANPLAFLELFRHGPRLAILATMRMLNFACDKSNLMQVAEVHRNQVLGLTLQQNALYMVSAFCVAAPGFALAGKLLRTLGTSTCLQAGMCMRTVESLIMSKATSLSVFRALLPLGISGASAATSVSAMLQDEAIDLEFQQGEFQACLSSLNTVTQVTMTMLWARLYAFGARRGTPGMYLQVVAMMCGIQLLLERILSKMEQQDAVTA